MTFFSSIASLGFQEDVFWLQQEDLTQLWTTVNEIALAPRTQTPPPPHHSHPRIRRPALEIEAPGPYRPVWGASPTCDGEVSAADSFWEAICGERDREKENPLGNHQQPPDASQQQQFLEWPLVVPLAAALPSLRSEPSSPALASISGHPGAEGGALVGGEGLGFLTCSVFKNKKVKNSINPGVRQEN